MKRYNLINNVLGWATFVIAAVTYLLTLEPTASFWDCPEFITQGFKLEVGHPPGNPIFMLTARFFVTLFGGTAQHAAIAVNTMSALLSAGTILLLFWTITHLVRKLTVDADATEIPLLKTVLIMGAGLCGALAYTWSDTFWFSAVEGEVYAFSSFCTALVFWLILKWENRADRPHSDRYLVLIAYVIGVSIAVHLLNLLCIPAIVLVFYYKKARNANVRGSLLALGLSAVIVGLILYGLVPGIIGVAQKFELLFVNTFHCPYNSGVLAYAVLLVAVFVWTVTELYRQRSKNMMKLSVFLSVMLSGITLIGDSVWISVLLLAALAIWLWGFCKVIPVRVFNVVILSIFVIFVGYSSYALLLIRSSAGTPMNQNSPDNVFDLASYLNRKQYGDRPLFYGQTIAEEPQWVTLGYDEQGNAVEGVEVDRSGYPLTRPVRGVWYEESMPIDAGTDDYAKVVKSNPDQRDQYVLENHHPDYKYSPDIKMLLTRMYSSDPKHVANYKSWAEYENPDFAAIPAEVRAQWAQRGYATRAEAMQYFDHLENIDLGTLSGGTPYSTQAWKPGWFTNLRYFLNYQLNHMYWRYFMWNFAGRQNDMAGNGEPHLGNWISGIPALDNLRLGNQDELPDEFGKDNPGHNVFYMLPLLMGILGLLWQALCNRHVNERRGIEQFWVVFFLFFMTGIAIVLYLNQTPGQPRERDYAFAGSFYAFAIWIGMGVPALKWLLQTVFAFFGKKKDKVAQAAGKTDAYDNVPARLKTVATATAVIIGILVPLQMVSQTWDDHDRSGRYTARDFGMNYLNSLDENAIIFTYGDNDTFPLWYAQEVEGVRTDVKVANLSYLETDWYMNQLRRRSYEAAPVDVYARPEDYAYNRMWAQIIGDPSDSLASAPAEASQVLTDLYNGTSPLLAGYPGITADERKHLLLNTNVYAPVDSAATLARFGRYPDIAAPEYGGAYMNLNVGKLGRQVSTSALLAFDIIANSAAGGWKRPVYFASTVPSSFYTPYIQGMYTTGMAKMVTPFVDEISSPVVDRAYENIMSKWRWGGLDSGKKLYLDETVRRMVSSTRLAILDAVNDLIAQGTAPASKWARDFAAKNGKPVPVTRLDMARSLLEEMNARMPADVAPFESMLDMQIGQTYADLWAQTGNDADLANARKYLEMSLSRYSQLLRYAASITPGWRASLGQSERQALAYPGIAVGMLNYLDLRQAMMRADAPAEELRALDATFGMDRGYEFYPYFYVMNLSDKQMEQLFADDPTSYVPAMVSMLRELHGKYAVNPQARTGKALKNMKISADEWLQLVRGR